MYFFSKYLQEQDIGSYYFTFNINVYNKTLCPVLKSFEDYECN